MDANGDRSSQYRKQKNLNTQRKSSCWKKDILEDNQARLKVYIREKTPQGCSKYPSMAHPLSHEEEVKAKEQNKSMQVRQG